MKPDARGALLVLALGVVLHSACAKPSAFTARNVLLISAGSLRADHLGCGGRPDARTPVWDRLARSGTQFRWADSASPRCAPSLATSMSGELPFEHGVRHDDARGFDPGVPPLAEALRDAGWHTAGFAPSGLLDDATGMGRGFAKRGAAQDADDALREATRWLRQTAADARFFLFVHGGEAGFADRRLARFLGDLEFDGRLDRTLIVATADHGGGAERASPGEALGTGEPPATLHEDTLRVPLVLWGPFPFRGGLVRSDPARLLDVYPTVLEAVRVGFVQKLEGRTLQERLEPWKTVESYAEDGPVGPWALRDGDWKLVRDPAGNEALFDLASDPAERRDRLDAEPERAAALRAGLESRLAP